MSESADSTKLAFFEEQVTKHHKKVLAYAMSLYGNAHVAEEVVQEALITAYKRMDKFEFDGSFPAWVRGIVRMKYLELHRNKREIALGDEIIDIVDREYQQWEEYEESSNQGIFSLLKKCSDKLPDSDRKIIMMFYHDRKRCQEIAGSLQLNEATVRKRLERIRAVLKQCIDKQMKLVIE